MSLSLRLTLLVTALLAACGAVAGVTVYQAQRRSLELELERSIEARLAWLVAALSVNDRDREVEFLQVPRPDGAAPHWWVATHDGRLLWSFGRRPGSFVAVSRTRGLAFGKPTWPLLPGAELREGDRSLDQVPETVKDAARRAVPGLHLIEADREDDRAGLYELGGEADGWTYTVQATAAGEVRSVRRGGRGGFGEYHFPKERRIELRIGAAMPAAPMRSELDRLAREMQTKGPIALLVTAVLLALLIRWQLRPLARMARQAGRIGPDTAGQRIGPVGTSAECVRLRAAINRMLDRLAAGLERERRFASAAAHELRTPLAQLKLAAEVALRRPREAREYREALADILVDVERLQKLVLDLLQLARSPAPGSARGRPVGLDSLLRGAAKDAGSARLAASRQAVPLAVEGDEDLLRSALANVLANAARYAPGEPPTIRIEMGDGHVDLVVADRGPGVPAADRERIFEPLTRLDAARSVGETADGYGLGLAVARAAARAFGGDLTCRTRADGQPGAEFVLSLRQAALPSPAARLEPSHRELTSL